MKSLAMFFISKINTKLVINFLLDALYVVLVKIFGKGVEEVQETIKEVQAQEPKLTGEEKMAFVKKDFDEKLKDFPAWFKDTFINAMVIRIKPDKVTKFIKEKLCVE